MTELFGLPLEGTDALLLLEKGFNKLTNLSYYHLYEHPEMPWDVPNPSRLVRLHLEDLEQDDD